MTFFNRKKQASFFLLTILVSQLYFDEASARPIHETHKASICPAKIISSEIAIKPTGSLQDTISRFQYQLLLIGVEHILTLKNPSKEIKQHSFVAPHVFHTKTFLFNRVLRI